MEHILDKTGLTYLWGKIKAFFATKEEVVRDICPYFDGTVDVDESDITDDYPEDSDYTDGYIIFDTNSEKFLLKLNNSYYTHWYGFSVYADCAAYNKYSGNGEISPKPNIYYDYGGDGIYCYDYVNSGLVWLKEQEQSDWNLTDNISKGFIKNKPGAIFLPIFDVITSTPANNTIISTTKPISYSGLYVCLCTANKKAYAYDSSASKYYTSWDGFTYSDVYFYDSTQYNNANTPFGRMYWFVQTGQLYFTGTAGVSVGNLEGSSTLLPITEVVSTSITPTYSPPSDYTGLVLCTYDKQVYAKNGSTYYPYWAGRVISNVYYPSSDQYNHAPVMYWLVSTNTIYNFKTSSSYDVIDLKPNLAAVATSGSYNDLINKPTLTTVATSGNYNDLSNKPTIPVFSSTVKPITSVITTAPDASKVSTTVPTSYTSIALCTANNQIYALKSGIGSITYYTRWNALTINGTAYLSSTNYRTTSYNTNNSIVAGIYEVVGSTTVYNYTSSSTYELVSLIKQADWNQTTSTAQDYIKNKPNLSTVATSGSYNDLSNKPDLSVYSLKQDTYKNICPAFMGFVDTPISNVITGSPSDYTNAAVIFSTHDQCFYCFDGVTYYTEWEEFSFYADYTIYNDHVTQSGYAKAGMYFDASTTTIRAYNMSGPLFEVQPLPTNVSAFTNDAGYLTSHQSISGKEDKMSISTASGTTLSAQVNTYYRFDSAVGTLAITLPVPSDATKVSSIIFCLTTASTTAVTFTSTATIKYHQGYEIAASKMYEINALYNGNAWIIMSNEIATS